MELELGRKQTEIGMMPQEWEPKTFGELFEFTNGVNAAKIAYGKGVRFINVLEPITYSHIYGPEIAGRVTVNESVANSYAVKRGDVLFNRTSETDGELGLAAVYLGAETVLFGGFVIRGRPTDDSLDPVFSGYALRAPVIRSQIIPLGQGAIRANISQQSLRTVIAPIPPRHEQCMIAMALTDVDALLHGLSQLIAKKRYVKHGAMQRLLTGETRLPGFCSQWATKSLEQLGKWRGGMTPSMENREYWASGTIPWISSGDVKTARLAETAKSITIAAVKAGVTTLLPANSIVVVARSGILRKYLPVATNAIPMAINQDIKALIPSAAFCPDFLLQVLIANGPRILSNCMKVGTTVESIEVRWFKSFTIPVPPLAEQKAIAAALCDMDRELTALESRRQKIRALKQAMTHQLLTGETRLVEAAVTNA